MRFGKHFFFSILCFLLTGCVKGGRTFAYLTLFFLDVGQGDAILIQDPLGGTALIDSGPPSTFQLNIRNDILALLRNYGVKKVDWLIATHPDADHIGGLEKILKNFPVAFYLDPHLPKSSEIYLDFLRLLRGKVKKGKVEYRKAEEQRASLGKSILEIFPAPNPPFPDPNDNSIITLLRYGNWSILFTGDGEEQEEKWLMEKFETKRLDAEGLKVSHHGSYTGSSLPFLQAVSPILAFISCGRNNRYGHPHPVVLERLNMLGVRIFRTDLLGTIRVRTDGEVIHIYSERLRKRVYSRFL